MSQSTAHLALASLKHKYQSLIQRHGALLKNSAPRDALDAALLDASNARREQALATLHLSQVEGTVSQQSATIALMDEQIQGLVRRGTPSDALKEKVANLTKDWLRERQAYVAAAHKANNYALLSALLAVALLCAGAVHLVPQFVG